MEKLPKPIFESPHECVTLTNYYDKYIICSGGVLAEKLNPLRDVIMYNIKRGEWSHCPPLCYANYNHLSCCVNGKVYLFFGQYKGEEDNIETMIPANCIERLDVESHIAGEMVEWEGFHL